MAQEVESEKFAQFRKRKDIDAIKYDVLKEYGGNGTVERSRLEDMEWVIDYLASKGHLKTTGEDAYRNPALPDPHPEYGPCDAIHPSGACAECLRRYGHLASTGRIRGELEQIATVFIGGQEFIVRRENHAAFTKLIEMFEPAAPGEMG